MKLDARSQTLATMDDDSDGNPGAEGFPEISRHERRRSSVRDVLASLAGDQIEALRREDEKRWDVVTDSDTSGGETVEEEIEADY